MCWRIKDNFFFCQYFVLGHLRWYVHITQLLSGCHAQFHKNIISAWTKYFHHVLANTTFLGKIEVGAYFHLNEFVKWTQNRTTATLKNIWTKFMRIFWTLKQQTNKIPRASITCSNTIKYFQKRKWNLFNWVQLGAQYQLRIGRLT